MSDKIYAPFTEEQAAALNRYQHAGRMHPFTCPRWHSDWMPPLQHDLIAHAGEGWTCSDIRCDYTQNWAHAFMLEPELGVPVVTEADRLRSILERLVAELHDASQVSGRDNMIRTAPLLAIIGDAVQCPDCLHFEKERQSEPACRYTFPLPPWAGEDQMDPCRCDLGEGHDGEHSCKHTRRENVEQQTDRDIIELTQRVAESDYEDYLDQGLRRRPVSTDKDA